VTEVSSVRGVILGVNPVESKEGETKASTSKGTGISKRAGWRCGKGATVGATHGGKRGSDGDAAGGLRDCGVLRSRQELGIAERPPNSILVRIAGYI